MEVIGTKRENLAERLELLIPITVEGRPSRYPATRGHIVIFGCDKTFPDGRVEEAVVRCDNLVDMQYCYDLKNGVTRTAWYTAPTSAFKEDLVLYTTDMYEIEQEFPDRELSD